MKGSSKRRRLRSCVVYSIVELHRATEIVGVGLLPNTGRKIRYSYLKQEEYEKLREQNSKEEAEIILEVSVIEGESLVRNR
jgi:hypothetical protein